MISPSYIVVGVALALAVFVLVLVIFFPSWFDGERDEDYVEIIPDEWEEDRW